MVRNCVILPAHQKKRVGKVEDVFMKGHYHILLFMGWVLRNKLRKNRYRCFFFLSGFLLKICMQNSTIKVQISYDFISSFLKS